MASDVDEEWGCGQSFYLEWKGDLSVDSLTPYPLL